MIVRVYYKSGIYEEGIENFHKFLSIFVDKSSILFAMLFASETEVDKMDMQSWIVELTDLYQSFGIVFAVLICFLEAFFPVLPLSVLSMVSFCQQRALYWVHGCYMVCFVFLGIEVFSKNGQRMKRCLHIEYGWKSMG